MVRFPWHDYSGAVGQTTDTMGATYSHPSKWLKRSVSASVTVMTGIFVCFNLFASVRRGNLARAIYLLVAFGAHACPERRS